MKSVLYFLPCALFLGLAHASAGTVQEWRFDVLLDDKNIGHHHFRVEDAGERRLVSSDAQFDVKFLFFSAYRYQHQNREIWSGGCLTTLASRTNDNGQSLRVEAQQSQQSLVVEASGQRRQLSGCVKSFAYWDPSFLDADKLLNAQTGEHLDVSVQKLDLERIQVRGETMQAHRYRLSAGDMTIDVWYSPQRQWVALESRTGGGRLRYRIQ